MRGGPPPVRERKRIKSNIRKYGRKTNELDAAKNRTYMGGI